jgi:hypothetical protein
MKWFRRGRKDDEIDLYRPLSEQEKALVEHDIDRPKGSQAPADATPDAPVNVEDVEGLDIPPLSPGQRAVVQHDLDAAHDAPTADDEPRPGT